MSDSSDKQLTVGDCGHLLPPNLHPRYCAESVIVLIKKYVIQISEITCKFSCKGCVIFFLFIFITCFQLSPLTHDQGLCTSTPLMEA